MKLYLDKDQIEIGIDEAGRGCLSGPVCVAGVIWNPNIDPLNIKDSKQLNKKDREFLYDYITENAIAWTVQFGSNNEIDKSNILNITKKLMHECINNIDIIPDYILVDGNQFNIYRDSNNKIIPHLCVINGDNKYISIAAASIIAKVEHDKYITNLIKNNNKLNIYDWENNMCYGTKKHIDAINQYGISKYHRLTFKPCINKKINY